MMLYGHLSASTKPDQLVLPYWNQFRHRGKWEAEITAATFHLATSMLYENVGNVCTQIHLKQNMLFSLCLLALSINVINFLYHLHTNVLKL